jgi:hypothetical protein
VAEFTQEPFRVGRVIGRSFSIWGRNLPLLFALALAVSTPRILSAVYQHLVPPPGLSGDDMESAYWWIPFVLRDRGMEVVRELFLALSEAAVIFAVYHRLRGEPATFAGSIRGAIRRILPVVGVATALFVLETAVWFAYLFLIFNIEPLDMPFYAGYLFAALVLFVLTPFWVAVPAAVIERSGSFLKRSWILTRGHRFRVFAILLIVYAINWGTSALCRILTEDLPAPVRMAVWWTKDLLVLALSAVLAVVGYLALRLEKDGADPPEVAEVFA